MTRSPRELATQKIQQRKQQEKLLSDLLTVVDDLDRAVEHWQKAEHRQASESPENTAHPTSSPATQSPRWQRWWQRWRQWFGVSSDSTQSTTQADSLADVVTSARTGIEMIRASMLEVLQQHQVEPQPAEGKPFDPSLMHALGQQVNASVAPNTVVQEVVRGYRWKDRTLREAQVIVAVTPASPAASDSAASESP